MREIKFRGKRIDTGEWVYGDLVQTKFEVFILVRQISLPVLSLPSGSFIEVVPESVGQFTGLPDKNKVDIYEGDVVKCQRESKHDPEAEAVTVIGQIVWESAFCSYVYDDGYMQRIFPASWDSDFEVIGKIYESPELIK